MKWTLSMILLLILGIAGCDSGGEMRQGSPGEGSAPDRGTGGVSDIGGDLGAGFGPDSDMRSAPGPLVLGEEDAGSLSYPLRLVDADGEVREVTAPEELEELLRGGGEAHDEATQPVEYVRLFYATDRRREPPGLRTILGPLIPAGIALLAAFVLSRLLKRWLKTEARRVGCFLSGLAFLAAGGLCVRGTLLSLETLRLSKETDVLYGSRRSRSGGLELGTVVVSIPVQNHEIARIEMPSLLRGELYPDPLRHFVIDDVHPMDRALFFEDLREAVASSPKKEAYLFVHGYNNTFAYAAMRLAQIVYDVGFEGAPILYSWPSKGAAALYTYDKENADWSAGNLAGFLADLADESGAEHIHLLAHSMGSRVLSTAFLQAIEPVTEGEESIFTELILAAPDIDADTFKRFIAPQLMRRSRRVTLYASERDEALLASVQVNGQSRAGMAGVDMVIVDGMDTVDVTAVAGGHAYISENGRVLGDLVDVVKNRLSAPDRATLVPRERGGERYWELVER